MDTCGMDAKEKWMIFQFTPTKPPPSQMDLLPKTFPPIILAAKWLVPALNMSPEQQRRTLPSLMYKSFFYVYGALFVQHLIPLTMPQNDPAPHWTSARSWRLMDMTSLHLQPGRSAAAVVLSSSCGAHRSCCAQRQLWCSAAAVVLMGAVVLIVDVVRMTAVGLSGSCCAHGSCCSQR